jgi:hypothetical protein
MTWIFIAIAAFSASWLIYVIDACSFCHHRAKIDCNICRVPLCEQHIRRAPFRIIGGTGCGFAAKIVSNTATSLTLDAATPMLDATSLISMGGSPICPCCARELAANAVIEEACR